MKNHERKLETRKKIQLGGLIKKSGLADETTAVILGMLLECKERLESQNDILRQEWMIKGDLALTLHNN